MTVSVVVPYRSGCPHREAAWRWVEARYAACHPDWQVVVGESPDGPFNRSAAILDGARKADGTVLFVADADVWVEPGEAAHEAVEAGWAVPHMMLRRLDEESTAEVLAGAEPTLRMRLAERAYRAHECGAAVAVRRDVLLDIPPDVRFIGWGQEDSSWSRALRVLHGRPWRGRLDLFHLWHPPQERFSRTRGNDDNWRLAKRYERTPGRERMRALVDESKEVCPWASNASTSTT